MDTRSYLLDRAGWRRHPVAYGLWLIGAVLVVGALVAMITNHHRLFAGLLFLGLLAIVTHGVALRRASRRDTRS